MDIASPANDSARHRESRKTYAVTMPDRAKYNGTPASTKLKIGEFISSETGNIKRPEYKHTRSLRGHPPLPQQVGQGAPMSTPHRSLPSKANPIRHRFEPGLC